MLRSHKAMLLVFIAFIAGNLNALSNRLTGEVSTACYVASILLMLVAGWRAGGIDIKLSDRKLP